MTQLEETRLRKKNKSSQHCRIRHELSEVWRYLRRNRNGTSSNKYITAYINVRLVQANVYRVSKTAARLGYPVVGRLQLLSIPQLHRPGKPSQVVMHSGAYIWLLIKLSVSSTLYKSCRYIITDCAIEDYRYIPICVYTQRSDFVFVSNSKNDSQGHSRSLILVPFDRTHLKSLALAVPGIFQGL